MKMSTKPNFKNKCHGVSSVGAQKMPYNIDDVASNVISQITSINFKATSIRFNLNGCIGPKSPQYHACHRKCALQICI